MEKRKPHYDLAHIKSLAEQGRVAFSNATLAGAGAFGMDEVEITRLIMELERTDFHQSRMADPSSKIWLDLYRPMTAYGTVYLKLKATDDLFVVSLLPKSAMSSAGR